MHTSIRMAAMAAGFLAVSGNAMAHSHDHGHDHGHGHNHGQQEVRHAGAHVHGEGELNFAVEGSELHLELMTPAHDILGFETITTDAQQQQLDTALAKLQSAVIWTLPAAAQCQLRESHASTSGQNNGDKHGHGHGHGHKHDHEHGHKEHKHDQGGHMDISATYVFQCENIGQLNQISTTLFEAFPRSETIRVQGFTSSGQLSETMNPRQPQVRF